ncbi:MAG: PaREP1 family protein [Pyrobaculum sp.]
MCRYPWKDLRRYVEIRLREAEAEADLAIGFLEEGLHRNAAGKAFQAWKAALVAAAALARDALAQRFRGKAQLREGEVELVDLVIALMPTSRMWEAARALKGTYGDDVPLLTAMKPTRIPIQRPRPRGAVKQILNHRTSGRRRQRAGREDKTIRQGAKRKTPTPTAPRLKLNKTELLMERVN